MRLVEHKLQAAKAATTNRWASFCSLSWLFFLNGYRVPHRFVQAVKQQGCNKQCGRNYLKSDLACQHSHQRGQQRLSHYCGSNLKANRIGQMSLANAIRR